LAEYPCFVGRGANYVPKRGELSGKCGVKGFEFSPDGSRCAYIAEDAGQQFLVIDGTEQRKFKRITQVQFSNDSRHVCYRAFSDEGQFIIVDSQQYGPFEVIDELGAMFSPIDGQFACCIYQNKKWRVMKNGKIVSPIEHENPQQVQFLPNSHQITYRTADLKGRFTSFIHGKFDEGHWDNINSYTMFSPNSKRWGYVVKQGENSHVFADNVLSQPYDTIVEGSLAYCSKAKQFVFAGTRDGRFIINADGEEIASYDGHIQFTSLHIDENETIRALARDRHQIKLIEIELKGRATLHGSKKMIGSQPHKKPGQGGQVKDQQAIDQFIRACKKHDTDTIILHFITGGTGNEISSQGETAFGAALSSGHVDTVFYLLSKKVDPNTVCSKGWTALHYALDKLDPLTAKLLIEAGVDYRIKSKIGETALDILKRKGRITAPLTEDQLPNLLDVKLQLEIDDMLMTAHVLRKQGIVTLKKKKVEVQKIRRQLKDLQERMDLYAVSVEKRFDPRSSGWIHGGTVPYENGKATGNLGSSSGPYFSVSDVGNFWKYNVEINKDAIIEIEPERELPTPIELVQAKDYLRQAILLTQLAFGRKSPEYKATQEKAISIAAGEK